MSTIIHEFTTSIPTWRPRVQPIKLDEATPEQLDALKVTPSNTKVSDYVLVLANDVETLKVRTPLFNAIMYNRGGMGRAERELSAVGASVVNRCVYCAAVHASRYNQLTKDEQVMEPSSPTARRPSLTNARRRSSCLRQSCPKRRARRQKKTCRRCAMRGSRTTRFSISFCPHRCSAGQTG